MALYTGQYEAAAEDFLKAAELGNKDALFQLALLHDKGKGVPQSETLKLDYLEKAAELNHDEACFMLAEIYSRDPQQADKALNLYTRAAEQMHPGAQLRMAETSFAKGDFATATDFATKAIAFFEETKGVFLADMTSDVGEKTYDLQKSNSMQANLILGKIMLQEGKNEEARLHFEKATSPEQPNAEALRHLGVIYAQGIGTQINYDKAIDCLLQAYETSSYNITDGTIAEMNKIVDQLMQESDPLEQVSEKMLNHLRSVYSGNPWKSSTVIEDYDTLTAVQQSLPNKTAIPKPSMINHKKILDSVVTRFVPKAQYI